MATLAVACAAIAASVAPAGANGLEIQDEIVPVTQCVPELSFTYTDFPPSGPGGMLMETSAVFPKSSCPLFVDNAPLGLMAEIRVSYRHRPVASNVPWEHELPITLVGAGGDTFALWEVPGEGIYELTAPLNITQMIDDEQSQFRLDAVVLEPGEIASQFYSTGWIDGPNMPDVADQFEDRPDDFTADPGRRQ